MNQKTWPIKWANPEWLLHLLCWLAFYSTLNVNWLADWTDGVLHYGQVAPLSAVLLPCFFYLNAFWLIPTLLTKRKWYQYFLLTAAILLSVEIVRCLVFILFNPSGASFIQAFIFEFTSRHNLIFGIPNSMFYAFVLSFAYRFSKDWVLNKQIIAQLKAEKIEAELNLLKSQIDPHFLFNNLNTLDDLIDRDSKQAKLYLQKLSNLYRFLVSNMDQNRITLQEEWDFLDDYIYLLETRFGAVYQFKRHNNLANSAAYVVPAAALQLLVENAVKHNQASPKAPLMISITVDQDHIIISNPIRPKQTQAAQLGTGLQNLKARYRLITDQEVQIKKDINFSVKLPLIPAIQ